jgi:hypothetical protein
MTSSEGAAIRRPSGPRQGGLIAERLPPHPPQPPDELQRHPEPKPETRHTCRIREVKGLEMPGLGPYGQPRVPGLEFDSKTRFQQEVKRGNGVGVCFTRLAPLATSRLYSATHGGLLAFMGAVCVHIQEGPCLPA